MADAHGRVPRRRRNDGAQPRGRARTRGGLRERDARRLSTGHVRARRPDAADPPARRERDPDGATMGTLADYLAGASPEGLSHWHGEMRSAARANLLPGVVSARIDLKAACGRAERWLERYAEPLQTLYGGDWPEPFLAQAWMRMFQNSAHDSICGCSADEVSAQVLVRYAEAEQIGRELAERAVARIAADVPRDAFVVVNPTPRERSDLVELELVVPEDWTAVELELPDGPRVPTQEIHRQEPH